jgi:hypothetical protein
VDDWPFGESGITLHHRHARRRSAERFSEPVRERNPLPGMPWVTHSVGEEA